MRSNKILCMEVEKRSESEHCELKVMFDRIRTPRMDAKGKWPCNVYKKS